MAERQDSELHLSGLIVQKDPYIATKLYRLVPAERIPLNDLYFTGDYAKFVREMHAKNMPPPNFDDLKAKLIKNFDLNWFDCTFKWEI